jgi:hypothetical protein
MLISLGSRESRMGFGVDRYICLSVLLRGCKFRWISSIIDGEYARKKQLSKIVTVVDGTSHGRLKNTTFSNISLFFQEFRP